MCRKYMCKGTCRKDTGTEAMGMAASQARFLGLTARKNNVEYEGQQINQQRTTLANQSANYYNDLLGMAVPVPPSVDSYTKTIYSFNDGALTNEITALIAQHDGIYKASYLQQWEDDFAPVSAATSVIMQNGTNYMVGNHTLRDLGSIMLKTKTNGSDRDLTLVDQANNVFKYDDGGDKFIGYDKDKTVYADPVGPKSENDEYLNTLTIKQLFNLIDQENDFKNLLEAEYGVQADGWFVRYVENTSDGTYKPFFYKKDTVEHATYVNNVSASSIDCYTIGSKTRSEEVKGKFSRVEKDATGRYINITMYESESDATSDIKGVKYSLTTSTITDQAAYEDAMNQYEFDKAKYDQSIQEINSKIEIVQAEDKNLELRLKQLDTEQDAISTEMDAVQKVIEKNTEASFKTFG